MDPYIRQCGGYVQQLKDWHPWQSWSSYNSPSSMLLGTVVGWQGFGEGLTGLITLQSCRQALPVLMGLQPCQVQFNLCLGCPAPNA